VGDDAVLRGQLGDRHVPERGGGEEQTLARFGAAGIPATPVRSRLPNVGTPPPFGSVAPLPGTLSVQFGAISRASRLADAYCGRTLLQSHCNSSATIMALEVHTPYPEAEDERPLSGRDGGEELSAIDAG
jgi:hypothetical protein